jgi:hypothetical protein
MGWRIKRTATNDPASSLARHRRSADRIIAELGTWTDLLTKQEPFFDGEDQGFADTQAVMINQAKECPVPGRLDHVKKPFEFVLDEIFGDWSHRIRITSFKSKMRFTVSSAPETSLHSRSSSWLYLLKGAIELLVSSRCSSRRSSDGSCFKSFLMIVPGTQNRSKESQ